MRVRLFAKTAAGLAVAAVVLAGCVVVEEGPGYRPPPPRPGPGPVACTYEYAPVCGERRGDRQSFPNACTARADGYRVVHAGECRRGGRPGPGPDRPHRACTREYAPVCARQGRDVRTFGNACEARAADYRIIGSGRC